MTKKQKLALAARLAAVKWQAAKGLIPLGAMSDDYLINCHNRCLRNGWSSDRKYKYSGYTQDEWATLFRLSLSSPLEWRNSEAELLKEILDGEESEAKQQFLAKRLAEAHKEWDRIQRSNKETCSCRMNYADNDAWNKTPNDYDSEGMTYMDYLIACGR